MSRLKIFPLGKEIDAAKSKCLVKSNSVTVTLIKKEAGNWMDLKEKVMPFKTKHEGKKDEDEKSDDPQASLMNMMKDMYDSGDSEMKKVIAQSWQKAQEDQLKKQL